MRVVIFTYMPYSSISYSRSHAVDCSIYIYFRSRLLLSALARTYSRLVRTVRRVQDSAIPFTVKFW